MNKVQELKKKLEQAEQPLILSNNEKVAICHAIDLELSQLLKMKEVSRRGNDFDKVFGKHIQTLSNIKIKLSN